MFGKAGIVAKVLSGSQGLWSWALGAKFWLAAIAIASAVSFGTGYVRATNHAENVLAEKVLEGYNKGAEAQRKFDVAERKRAVADALKRGAANKSRDEKAAAVIADLPILVPHNDACTVSAEAMRRLNEITQ